MTIDLQSHKIQLSPTLNVSGGTYSDATGNDATNLLLKHNALVQDVETELNNLQEKVLSYFFPTLPNFGQLLHTDKSTTITKLKCHSTSQSGSISLLWGDPGAIMLNNVATYDYSSFFGYSWKVHNITQNNIVTANNAVFFNASGNPTNVTMLLYYI